MPLSNLKVGFSLIFLCSFSTTSKYNLWSQGNQKKQQREKQMLKRICGLRNAANYAEWHFYLSGHFRRTYKALPHRILIVDSKNFLKNISLFCLLEIAMFCFMVFMIFRWKMSCQNTLIWLSFRTFSYYPRRT